MRQIALDTETTGIGADIGHRIIEIGCVEMIDRKITGKHFHVYLNPERAVDDGAFKVHGLNRQFLQDKPLFADIMDDFLAFIDQAELIIHNAPFDVGFLNAELERAKWPQKISDRCSIHDTLAVARKKHPGQRNSLDALCKRYFVDNTRRTLHGALLDAEILSYVYLAMSGGQGTLSFDLEQDLEKSTHSSKTQAALKSSSGVLAASVEELARHEKFMQFLVKKSGVKI